VRIGAATRVVIPGSLVSLVRGSVAYGRGDGISLEVVCESTCNLLGSRNKRVISGRRLLARMGWATGTIIRQAGVILRVAATTFQLLPNGVKIWSPGEVRLVSRFAHKGQGDSKRRHVPKNED
jgi:hypothetical protein